MDNPILSAGEFLRGQADCQGGEVHKAGQSVDYDRGYSTQYELEQVQTELSRGH